VNIRQLLAAGGLIVATMMVGACTSLIGPPVGSCACASLSTMVPWPVSEDQALSAARGYVTGSDLEAGRSSIEPQHVYAVIAPEGLVLVDGDEANVLEAVFLSALPSEPGRSITPREAIDAARAFLDAHPASPVVTGEPMVEETAPALDAVSWQDGDRPIVLVAVNASTGEVASFVDVGRRPGLIAATISKAEAARLAIAAFGVANEQALSMEIRVEIDGSGRQRTVWSVGLGVPSPTQSDVYEDGGLVEVDAVTGEASIIKR
jgi:hypothetical protein